MPKMRHLLTILGKIFYYLDSLESRNPSKSCVQPEDGRALNDELLRQSSSFLLHLLGRGHHRLQDLEQAVPKWGKCALKKIMSEFIMKVNL